MATLQGAITEIITQVGTVAGIKHAPTDPQEQVTAWPAAFAYTTDGALSPNRASIEDKSLHNISIAVLMPLTDLRQCMLVMLPLYELIMDVLITHLNDRASSHYAAWGGIRYTLGPVDWGGNLMFGYVFTIENVKIRNAL